MLYDVYTHVMSIFGIYLLFSQIDFLIIRCIADVLVTLLTTAWFMQHKTMDPKRYMDEVRHVACTEPTKGDETELEQVERLLQEDGNV